MRHVDLSDNEVIALATLVSSRDSESSSTTIMGERFTIRLHRACVVISCALWSISEDQSGFILNGEEGAMRSDLMMVAMATRGEQEE